MKELHGSATASVTADPEESFVLLAAVDQYPAWYPEAIRGVEVLERSASGTPERVLAELDLAYGPLKRSFELTLAVLATHPREVRLTRTANEPGDPEKFEVVWRIAPASIALELTANLSVPRLLPVAGVGESLANDFVSAAARRLG